jgi:hypothetical protein
MLKKKIFILLAALTFAVGGCKIHEDMIDCPYPLRLNFLYTLNEKYENDLEATIQDIRIYVYDTETGILVAIYRATPEEIDRGYKDISLPHAGSFTLVAWASSNPDMFQDGMEEGQIGPPVAKPDTLITPQPLPLLPDTIITPQPPPLPPDTLIIPPPPPDTLIIPPPPVIDPVKPGQTTIDNSHMGVNTNPGPGGSNVPQNDQFGDTFNDSEQTISRGGRDLEEIDLDFTKTSSLLNVQIRGLETLPASVNRPLHVFVTGRNGSLTPNGDVSPNAPDMRYEPYSTSSDNTSMEALIQTLKLQMNMETSQPMLLHIQDRVTGNDIVAPLNLITLIRNIRRPDGTPRYPTQEEIDRENEFRIQLDFGANAGGGLRVTINGFVVEILIPIL